MIFSRLTGCKYKTKNSIQQQWLLNFLDLGILLILREFFEVQSLFFGRLRRPFFGGYFRVCFPAARLSVRCFYTSHMPFGSRQSALCTAFCFGLFLSKYFVFGSNEMWFHCFLNSTPPSCLFSTSRVFCNWRQKRVRLLFLFAGCSCQKQIGQS